LDWNSQSQEKALSRSLLWNPCSMPPVAELVAALAGASRALVGAREGLQRAQAAEVHAGVLKDNLAAEMRSAEAMIKAAAEHPAVLAREPLFAVDVENLTLRMQSVTSTLASYESVPFMQRLICGGIPAEYMTQQSAWINEWLRKWRDKLEELMAMTPEELDAVDFSRARPIFARPLLLTENNDNDSECKQLPLLEALEDMQVSVVTGHLYKRGSSQKHVLQDIGFSLASHRFRTRGYNKGRDQVVAKLSECCNSVERGSPSATECIASLTVTLNDLLPTDMAIGEAEPEKPEAEEPIALAVRCYVVPPDGHSEVKRSGGHDNKMLSNSLVQCCTTCHIKS